MLNIIGFVLAVVAAVLLIGVADPLLPCPESAAPVTCGAKLEIFRRRSTAHGEGQGERPRERLRRTSGGQR